MKIAFTWDDGALEDQILFELHEKYAIPATFFVPTYNREGRETLPSEIIRKSKSDLLSFGGHTQHHVYLTSIPLGDVENEIVENKKYLEDTIGEDVQDFCFPGGKYNGEILVLALKHYKTVRTADTMCFGRYQPRMIKPTFHMYPRGYKSMLWNSLRNKSLNAFFDLLCNPHREYFQTIHHFLDKYGNDDIEIVFWGHSWEIEEMGLWKQVEDIMQHVSEQFRDKCLSYRAFCNLVRI